CAFYYLLSGRVPFPGGTALEKLVRHGTEEPEPVERLRPDILWPVAQVLRRMMAKDPRDRFQTATEVAEALEPFVGMDAPQPWLMTLPAGSGRPVTPSTPLPATGSSPRHRAEHRVETQLDASDTPAAPRDDPHRAG